MTLPNPNGISKEAFLEGLDELHAAVETDVVTKAYMVWTGKDGENYDETIGFGLVELTGVLEVAKHMQLQNYVQATVEGLDFGQTAEEMAKKLHVIFNVRAQDVIKKNAPGLDVTPPLDWDDLPAEDRKFWVAAVRTVIPS